MNECGSPKPDGVDQECMDTLTAVVNEALVNVCTSEEYMGALEDAKSVCGSSYEILSQALGLCEFYIANT